MSVPADSFSNWFLPLLELRNHNPLLAYDIEAKEPVTHYLIGQSVKNTKWCGFKDNVESGGLRASVPADLSESLEPE